MHDLVSEWNDTWEVSFASPQKTKNAIWYRFVLVGMHVYSLWGPDYCGPFSPYGLWQTIFI